MKIIIWKIKKSILIFYIILLKIYYLIYEYFHKDYIILTSSIFPLKYNWGDNLSRILVGLISPSTKIITNRYTYNFRKREDYLCIGSIITWMTTSRSIIWGSGVVYPDKTISAKPKQVLAVRGPLTRAYLQGQGITCPEIYGDPALLLPRYYQPASKQKKYKLGIVPHMRDHDNPIVKALKRRDDLLIIDVRDIHPWTKVVDQINQCEHIISSSLHGIIVADAYEVPNRWVEFEGGEQKAYAFHDYLQSVGHDVDGPVIVTKQTKTEDLIGFCQWQPLKIDLEKLMSVCPFIIHNKSKDNV